VTLSRPDQALLDLGRYLRASGYRHVTPTPATHARVLARSRRPSSSRLRDVLGWSRPFRSGELPGEVETWLTAAGALRPASDGTFTATVRYSTLDDDGLFVHSAYPTGDSDAVFFGPDTYRFVAAVRRHLRPTGRLVDVGAGSGVGGIAVADWARTIVLADINPATLRLAAVNAALAGVEAELVTSDVLAGVTGPVDAVIANPPYLVDPSARLYRHGGGALGFDLALRIVDEGLARLTPGGQLLLYTGSPVVDGRHPLRDALGGRETHWEELDPDVFGEELDTPAYAEVDRIAAVLVVLAA
jgi:methylase of polypeptide subunit release factors